MSKSVEAESTQSGQFVTDDASEFEAAVRPWDLIVDDLGSSDPCFEIDFLTMPGLTIYQDRYPAGAHLRGMPAPNQLVLGIPIGNAGGSAFWASDVVDRQLYAMHETALEARYAPWHSNLVILLDLDQAFRPSLALAVEKLMAHHRSQEIAQSRQEVLDLAQVMLQFLKRSSAPQSEAQLGELGSLRDTLEDSLAQAVLSEGGSGPCGRYSTQAAAVSAAMDFLRRSDANCRSVSELCRKTGVNERTLERGVRAEFDCTVVQLLRRWRLRAARQRLRALSTLDTSVTEVAFAFGFYDLGRFAMAYRHQFGESPSVTLAGPARTSKPLLLGV